MATTSAVNFTSTSLSVNEPVNTYLSNESKALHGTDEENNMGACDYETTIDLATSNHRKRYHSPYLDKGTSGSEGSIKLGTLVLDSEFTKKRRKQSTPIKISSTVSPTHGPKFNVDGSTESGKPNTDCDSPKVNNETGAGIVTESCFKAFGEEPLSRFKQEESTTTDENNDKQHRNEDEHTNSRLPTDINNQNAGNNLNNSSWGSSNNVIDEWMTSTSGTLRRSYQIQSPGANHMSPLPLLNMDQQAAAHFLSRTGQSRVRIFNPDAYCELCNKEFCNKYFLKTHKANKHGIYSEFNETCLSTPKLPGKYWPNISNCNNTNSTEANTPLTKESTGSFLKVRSHEELKKILPNHKDGKPTQKDAYKIEFSTGDNLVSHSENNNSNTSHKNPSETNTDSPFSQRNESPGVINYHDLYSMKPNFDPETDQEGGVIQWPFMAMLHSPSFMQAIPRPHGLGIVNPEAFCDICCKEYCNKYFLRTHKLKRHGTLITDEGVKDLSSSGGTNMQTSPLNLILSEQANSSDSFKSHEEVACGLCGMYVTRKHLKSHLEACQNEKRASLAHKLDFSQTVNINSGVDEANAVLPDENEICNDLKKLQRIKMFHQGEIDDETMGEDLRKLQTMIFQLNSLNICQVMTCEFCNKDFDNKIYLQAHMLNEHGPMCMKLIDEKLMFQNTTASLEKLANLGKMNDGQTLKESSYLDTPQSSQYISIGSMNCPTTGQDILTNEMKNDRLERLDKMSQPRSASIISMTPTNSYCEICNKELCNKYFMKTHMQRMHGIEIENGAQIGGVVCNVCNKELCSKYFLRVHKQNTHGIVEDGIPIPQTKLEDSNQSNLLQNASEPTIANPNQLQTQGKLYPTDSSLRPNDLGDLNHRYFAHFTEVCSICSRRFRSTKWLKAHLLADHGKEEHDKFEDMEAMQKRKSEKLLSRSFEEKVQVEEIHVNEVDLDGGKMVSQDLLSNILGSDKLVPKNYYCSFCEFSTPVLAFLFVHERSHNGQQTSPYPENVHKFSLIKCDRCEEHFPNHDILQRHMIVRHSDHIDKHKNDESINDDKTDNDETDKIINNHNANVNDTFNLELESVQQHQSPNKSSDGKSTVPNEEPFLIPFVVPKPQEEKQQNETAADVNANGEMLSGSRLVMQPFLIEEFDSKEGDSVKESARLVPTVILLPVRERVTTPLVRLVKFTPTEQVPK